MANINYQIFTLGIEEEYMVLDPQTRELKSHEQKIVTEGQKVIKDKVKAEMHQAVASCSLLQFIDDFIIARMIGNQLALPVTERIRS